MSKQYNWPSREEWADRRRHPYWDCETGCPFDDKFKHRLSDYATREEITALVTALNNLYRDKGRELRVANQRAKERGLPKESRSWELQEERHSINKTLAHIREDGSASFLSPRVRDFAEAKALLEPFQERYDAAYKAAEAQWERECEQIPVDDAAWEQELERRRQLDDYFAHPEKRIHHI
jgi:hypothetical protein